MKPSEWNLAIGSLSGPNAWKQAYPLIEREARALLDTFTIGADPYSTSELVEHLYPAQFARQSDAGQRAREWIFKALIASKNPWRHLYATQGSVRLNGINKGSRPWLWGAYRGDQKARTNCPTCGQEMF